MSDESQKSRSPNSPKIALQDALATTEELYKKTGRSSVSAEGAASALGYQGLTGTSMSLLGALNQYGLIDRGKGTVQVSALALRILHPISAESKLAAIREAALVPPVFLDIHQNYRDLETSVLANQLIHKGFANDIAKRVATAFKANVDFAKLTESGTDVTVPENGLLSVHSQASKEVIPASVPEVYSSDRQQGNRSLAKYTIPLGATTAELSFTGESLEPEDFDALIQFVELFKKQFERKVAAQKNGGANRGESPAI